MAPPSTMVCLMAAALLMTASCQVTMTGKVYMAEMMMNGGRSAYMQMLDQQGRQADLQELVIPGEIYVKGNVNDDDTVEISGQVCSEARPDCPKDAFLVSSLKIVKKALIHERPLKAVAEPFLKTLVLFANVCNAGVGTTPAALQNVLFDSPTAGRNVQKMFNSCSFGKHQFTSALTKIYPTTIPIPCTGSITADTLYTWSPGQQCDDSALRGMLLYARWYYTSVLKQTDIDSWTRTVLVMPPTNANYTCDFGGYATQSCFSGSMGCWAWINGDSALSPRIWVHEMGHTISSGHAAGLDGGEYSDRSDVMGCCGNVVCFNAPHMAQQGWTTPIVRLNNNTFPTNRWLTYTVPAKNLATQNFIMVQPNWMSGALRVRDYYISYVTRHGEDYELSADYAGMVMVHNYLTILRMGGNTYLDAVLPVGGMYPNATGGHPIGLVVRVLSKNETAAQVSVCRQRIGVLSDCSLSGRRFL